MISERQSSSNAAVLAKARKRTREQYPRAQCGKGSGRRSHFVSRNFLRNRPHNVVHEVEAAIEEVIATILHGGENDSVATGAAGRHGCLPLFDSTASGSCCNGVAITQRSTLRGIF